MATSDASECADETVLRAIYPRARGRLTLRGGSAGLSWFEDRAPDEVDGDVSTFRLDVPHYDPVQLKLVREDGRWMKGRNAVIGRGARDRRRDARCRRDGEHITRFVEPSPGRFDATPVKPASHRRQSHRELG